MAGLIISTIVDSFLSKTKGNTLNIYFGPLKLDYRSRLEYVRDPNNLPEKTVFDMQMEASKFFRSTQTKAFSGSLGRNKIEGIIYRNQRTQTVAFVNKSVHKCRSVIKMKNVGQITSTS